MLLCLLLAAVGADAENDTAAPTASGPAVVELKPSAASLSGQAQNKCWPNGCFWVVWCGHNICDGAWQWSFPATGTYELVWEHVSFKCAGSPPYELRINRQTVRSGRLAQYGSCGECAPSDLTEKFADTSLGEYALQAGDRVTLRVKNDFACGIDGPGAYAAFKGFSARRRD